MIGSDNTTIISVMMLFAHECSIFIFEWVQYRVTHLLANLGWVDLDLGSFPGWWATTVATYCPSRMVEHPKSKSTQPRFASRWVTLYSGCNPSLGNSSWPSPRHRGRGYVVQSPNALPQQESHVAANVGDEAVRVVDVVLGGNSIGKHVAWDAAPFWFWDMYKLPILELFLSVRNL